MQYNALSMQYPRAKEIRIWWPLPLATLLWLIIIWGFGFFLTSPEVESVMVPPIQASFVEFPEEQAAQKSSPTPQQSPKASSQPKPLGMERAKPPKPVPEKETAKNETPASLAPPPQEEAPKDLMAYVNAARERRRAAENIFGDKLTEPKNVERELSEEELRMANIRRNLREPSAGGIFQITWIGTRSAQFLFRAWKNDSSSPRRELVEVTAGPDGDIQRAIVRKMIELIRQYQKGDFTWESYRLGYEVVLSARMEDSKGLEDFLMREFFN